MGKKKRKRLARVRAYKALMLITQHPKIQELLPPKVVENVKLAAECLNKEYPKLPQMAVLNNKEDVSNIVPKYRKTKGEPSL